MSASELRSTPRPPTQAGAGAGALAAQLQALQLRVCEQTETQMGAAAVSQRPFQPFPPAAAPGVDAEASRWASPSGALFALARAATLARAVHTGPLSNSPRTGAQWWSDSVAGLAQQWADAATALDDMHSRAAAGAELVYSTRGAWPPADAAAFVAVRALRAGCRAVPDPRHALAAFAEAEPVIRAHIVRRRPATQWARLPLQPAALCPETWQALVRVLEVRGAAPDAVAEAWCRWVGPHDLLRDASAAHPDWAGGL